MKDAFSIDNINTYQNISWKDRIGNGWKINTAISFSTNKDDIVNEVQDGGNEKFTSNNPLFNYKNFNLLNKANYAQARMVFEKKLFGLNAIRFGTDYFTAMKKLPILCMTVQNLRNR